MTKPHVIILGAGAAGAAAARVLGARNDIRVTVVARTGETPYTRMFIKGIAFGPASPETITLALPDVDLITDTAETIDPAAEEVQLASGARIGYDALVIATGSRARTLQEQIPGSDTTAAAGRVSTLYSLEDALQIRELLSGLGRRARVAIYGGGIIAAETASMLHTEGHMVMLISRSTVPGASAFGAPVAERLAAEHSSRVLTRFGRTVQHLETTDTGVVITLDNDSPVIADMLLLGLGTTPSVPDPWADGVRVDSRLRADAPHVYGAGGAALHHDDALGTWRIDHWDDAAAQGEHAAQAALHDLGLGDDPGPYLPRSPYMAMIYGQMISGIGLTSHAETYLHDGDEFVVRHEANGTVVGVSGIDAIESIYQWGSCLHEERV